MNQKTIRKSDGLLTTSICRFPRPMMFRSNPAAKTFFAATLLLFLALLPSRAALMAYEGFNYTVGTANLTGLTGSFGWNGIWQGVNNGSSGVQSGSMIAGASAPAGYDSLSTGNSVLTPNNTRTGRFLDTSPGGLFAAKGYIDGNGNIGASGKTIYISFMQQPNGTTSYYEFEFHKNDLGDNGRRGGVGNDSGGNTGVYLRVPSAGQTLIGSGNTSVNFYVVRIDFLGGNDTVYVYQNPTSATEPGSPTLLKTSAGDMAFNGISFGCFNNGRTVAHDEVRVGETWADVTSGAATYGTGNWNSGTSGNWSTAASWTGSLVPTFATALTFAGSTGLNSTNDFTGVLANGITFDSAAGAFTLAGNSLKLGVANTIGFNGTPSSPVTQTINLPLAPSGNFTIDTRTNGSVTINGNITMSTGSLISNATNGIMTQTSSGNAGMLTLAGTNTLNGFIINGGTNRITGSTTVTLNNTRFCLANQSTNFNATMIIESGANLTISGTGVDAGVIGRDGGIGRVIQNGGTFSFNIPNNPRLFINASGNTGAGGNGTGVYSMNGGLFDMNNNVLSPGLGANSVVLTGYVNQVGGVITNVGQLVPGWNSGQNGRGVYNLTGGTMYITGISGVGITSQSGKYDLNLGGGTMAAEASWSSALNMNLTGVNGPLTFNPNGNVITLTGSLSGTGGLTVNGAGALALNGANTYTGITRVMAGSTLEFDVTGTSFGSIRLDNNAILNLNYSGTRIVASFYTNGVALPVGTYDASLPGGFIVGSGQLQVSSGISTGIWDGGGANNNWSTGGNWDQDSVPVFPIDLTFAGSTRLANNNDLSSITANSITFAAAAGAFTLSGNDITLNGSIGFNGNPSSPVTQTANMGMTWTANQTIDTPTNGNLTLNGNINSGFTLTKTGAGTLTFGGTDGFSSYILNGGTNVITGNVTVVGTGGGSRIALGNANSAYNGALVIQPGSTLSVFGSYVDALVVGRDSGSGTVIQNGGTFTFSPSDHGFIFVGASSNPGTKAEYDMNGGVLDMGGNTLSVGLADGGTTVTGVLNQTGGTINNVGNFWFSPVQAGGLGIYTLSGGSIYLGFSGITTASGNYKINLGGGTVGAFTSWSSSLNMNLTNLNGSVTFDPAGNAITLSGALSGNGGLIVTNSGLLVISGVDSYTGDTVISAGTTLEFDNPGTKASVYRMVDGATLSLNYSGTRLVPGLYTNGVALPNGVYNSGNLPGFITGSGDLQVAAAISTGLWDGGGADNNWSTGGNWDFNVVPVFPIGLTFAGSTRLANNNDLSSLTVNSLTFDAAAGAFVLGGNDITLAGTIGFSASPAAPVTQTVNMGMTWTANKTIDLPANGTVALGGNITTSANNLTQTGAGTLVLGGVDSFAGYAINGGTNVITGTVTANGTGGSRFVLANANAAFDGTLVIQPGATFNVTGNWTDAGVIGRDAGKGTVTQNGGLFNFNMGNQPWLFVGASGFAGTVATYNMNGGVLDMNGKQLGVALAVNGITVTGVVNQVSGVITNVGELRLGVVGGQQGNGKYNLTGGSLYIGATGITSDSGIYQINLGGGTVGALANWSSPLNMTLTGINGPVTFDTDVNSVTLSGALSGSGGLTKAGSGTLVLAGPDTYTGNTTINAGTLQLNLSGTSASAIHIVDGALLNLNYGGTLTVPACYTNGVALASGVYTSANLPAFITGTGSLTISAGTPPVVNAPVVSGGNLILTGSGGTAGAGYTWLSATNLMTPIASWITNMTGTFDGSGNFSNAIPVSTSTPDAFFRLRTP